MDSDEGGALQSALIDQKMRADRHKSNFETLKAQHLNLQEMYADLQLEHETITERYDHLHQKSQDIIQKLQLERDNRILECENLKKQTYTGLKLEKLKLQLAEEIEEPFRKRAEHAEAQHETILSELNKMKYKYSFVTSEYEAMKSNHKDIIQELTDRHEAEIQNLIEEKKFLQARVDRDVPADLQRIRQLERDNAELRQRVKSLIAENEQLQTEKETIAEHVQQTEHLHSRQIVELQAHNKTIEMERSSLAEQVQSLQNELTKAHEQHHTLSEQLTATKRELTNSTRKKEELEHTHKMEISELKMRHLEHSQELEQQREHCLSEYKTCKAQLESLTDTLQQHDALLADTEQKVEQRVQMAREKEWEKQVVLEREKVELEERLNELQRLHDSSVKDAKSEVDRLELATNETQSQKSQLESELEVVTVKLQEKSAELQSLFNEMQEISKLGKKHQVLLVEHRTLQRVETELSDSKRQLEDKVAHLEEELSKVHQEMILLKESHQEELRGQRQCWSDEREVLNRRIDECQERHKATHEKFINAKKEAKKLQKHYKKQVTALKQSLQLQSAELQEMITRKESVESTMTLENQKLKNRISQIQRKNKEFHVLLQQPVASTSSCLDHHDKEWCRKLELEEMSHRVTELEENLQQQLPVLPHSGTDLQQLAASDNVALSSSSSLSDRTSDDT